MDVTEKKNPHPTTRSPDDVANLAPDESQMTAALQNDTNFYGDDSSFSNSLEGVHDDMHVWTGGDMESVPTSAFDPIFFMHHCNVDRMWAKWQKLNPQGSSTIPADVMAEALATAPGLDWGTFRQQVENIPVYDDATTPNLANLNIGPVALAAHGGENKAPQVVKVTGFNTDVSRTIKIKSEGKLIATIGVFGQESAHTGHEEHGVNHVAAGKRILRLDPSVDIKKLTVESTRAEDVKDIKFVKA